MKKYIQNYSEFINEGARLIPPNYDIVELTWLNDPKLPLEVLKSNRFNDVTGFRKLGNAQSGSFQVYYGLEVDAERTGFLGDQDPLFKLTLDKLKNSKILNLRKELSAFINPTANEIKSKKGKIDYVVSLGSTAGLSKELGNLFSEKFRAKHLTLSKMEFDNFASALNWEYIRDYDEKVRATEKEDDPKDRIKPILGSIKSSLKRAIDTEKTPAHVMQMINDATSADELRSILLRSNPDYRYQDPDNPITIVWVDKPFIIRSSGVSFGGSRNWLKTKYDTPKATGEFGNPDFVEAVKQCIIGTSTLMLVDDNARTKEDISSIFEAIARIADEIFKDIGSPNATMINYHKRIFAYVLIYIPTSSDTSKDNLLVKDGREVKKLASSSKVDAFVDGGLESIQKWIEQSNKWLKEKNKLISQGKRR